MKINDKNVLVCDCEGTIKFDKKALSKVFKGMDLEINTWCGPEAQVAALSDDIAYFSHDFEDGIRANFFSLTFRPGAINCQN